MCLCVYMLVYIYADVCTCTNSHCYIREGRMRVAYAAYKHIYARTQGPPSHISPPPLPTETTSNFSLNSPIESAKIETSA